MLGKWNGIFKGIGVFLSTYPPRPTLMTSVVDNLTANALKLWSTYFPNSSPGSLVSPTAVNTTILASLVFVTFVAVRVANASSDDEVKVPYKRGIPFIGSWAFFTQRIRFVEEGLKTLGTAFRFNILHVSCTISLALQSLTMFQHKVLVVSGEESRKVFFGSKNLHLAEGYKVLFGGVRPSPTH